MTGKWYVVVSYDVTDDGRRGRMAEVLLGYGARVQKSVFDCLLDERRLLELEDRLRGLMDETEDSVRYYVLCGSCERRIVVHGRGAVMEEEGVIVV